MPFNVAERWQLRRRYVRERRAPRARRAKPGVWARPALPKGRASPSPAPRTCVARKGCLFLDTTGAGTNRRSQPSGRHRSADGLEIRANQVCGPRRLGICAGAKAGAVRGHRGLGMPERGADVVLCEALRNAHRVSGSAADRRGP
jgi:hypothetical protein